MSSKFDAYEIIGVVTPGSVLLFGFSLLFPQLKSIFFEQGFSVGDLGLFLILAFVAGHLIQAVGNLVEKAIWRSFGGMPTDWLIKHPRRLISDKQFDRLRQAVEHDFDLNLQEVSALQWSPTIREIYAYVQANGDTVRIDSFNRTYGLMRGVTAAFGVLAVITAIVTWPAWKPLLLAAIITAIAAYRMVRFGKRYACELVVGYLRLTRHE